MNAGKTVFAQLMEHVPRYEFGKCVNRYGGEVRVRKFSCRDQFCCMAFGQLTFRESLRDIEACLPSMQSKLYHIGIRGTVWAPRVDQWSRGRVVMAWSWK